MPSMRLLSRFALTLAVLYSVSPVVSAQITNVTNSTSTPTPSIGHDYTRLLNEIVDPVNGSVSVRLSIPVPPARGLTLPFAFAYDSNSSYLQPLSWSSRNTLKWAYQQNVFATGPWSNTIPQLNAQLTEYIDPSQPTQPCFSTTGYVFRDSSGGRHALGLSGILSLHGSGGLLACNHSFSYGTWQNHFTGGDDFVKASLSGIPANGGYSGISQYGASAGQVRVADASGTVHVFGSTNWDCLPGAKTSGPQIVQANDYALPTTIEDRNGNLITIAQPCAVGTPLTLSDTTSRTALTLQTSGGVGSNVINSITVSGVAQPYALTWGGAGGTSVNLHPTQTVIVTPNNCTGVPSLTASGNVINTLILPNGKQYVFNYDPTYGLLSKITYPGGGYVSYSWGLNPQSAIVTYSDTQANVPNDCIYTIDKPAILHRYVSFDGINIALQQDFSYSTTWTGQNWSSKQTTVTTTDLIRGTSFQTVYSYSGLNGPSVPNMEPNNWDSQLPVETTITYKSTTGTVLRTVRKSWFNADEMASELQKLENGMMSSVCYGYGTGHTITDKREFDYGQITSESTPCPTGVTPARETVTTYQSFANTPIFTSGPSIFDRPATVITYGNGVRVAETDYAYDQALPSCPGSPNCVTATAHDETNYGVSSTAPRGNAMTITKQCFQGAQACTNAVTKYTFDNTGQVLSQIDPCGNATCGDMTGSNHTTTYSYTNNFDSNPSGNTNAYVYQIANPLGQVRTFKYAYSDGQLISSTDPNNLTTSYIYADSLRRLSETDFPDGGSTKVCFTDAGGAICSQGSYPYQVITQKTINSASNLLTTAVIDGMGHTTQTQLNSDPQGTVFTDTSYDGLGRVRTRSSPYRSGADITTTSGTTTTYYDEIGRPCLVVPPDGTLPSGPSCPATQPAGTIFTTYSGNSTTVTDQTGRSRKSVADGLGRVTQVFEDPSGLNYETDYSFDALNNLLCAGQKGNNTGTFTNCASIPASWRPRNFTYDSLSRMLTSANPEVGTITYTYDANSNVSTKKDARNITITYGYDVLNREKSKTYSNSDPTVATNYDESNCLGLSTCQNIGYRTSMTDGAGSEIWAYQVDATNLRSLQKDQRTTDSVTKTATYLLDLAGNTTQITYPNGRVVNYTFDSANRPSTASDSINGITVTGFKTTPGSTCIANVTCYSPQGTLYAVSIGQTATFNGVNITHIYNSRLQPQQFKASSTGGNAIDITYSYADPIHSNKNAGHVFSITNNLDSTRSQNFTYDQLNRITGATTASTFSTSPSHCWGEAYGLDAWGNLQSISPTTLSGYTGCSQQAGFSQTADSSNHLSGFGYDVAGNTSGDGVNSYTWNAESQLKTAAGVTYHYDGDGRRVSKLGSKLYWYGLGSEILAETNTSGTTTAAYIFFDGKRIATVPAGGNPTYYVEDMLGTSRVLTTNSGVLCYDADFYPYGGERAPYTNSCPQNYKFEGKERDVETGNDDFGARYYSWRYGRWLSADWSAVPVPVPYANLTNPQTLNLYSMVADDPESFADLDGHLRFFTACEPVIPECSLHIGPDIGDTNESGLGPTNWWRPHGFCWDNRCIIGHGWFGGSTFLAKFLDPLARLVLAVDKFGINGIIEKRLQEAAKALGISLSKAAAQAIRKEMTDQELEKLKKLKDTTPDKLERLEILNAISDRIKDPAVRKELDDIGKHKQDIIDRIKKDDQHDQQ